MTRLFFALCTTAFLTAGPVWSGSYTLQVTDKGLREYYCQINVTLENKTNETLTEISGFFYSYVGSIKVGRSKGAWFMNVPPGQTASAIFETPNAPCDTVDRYEFIVGACRFDAGFVDKTECAGHIEGLGAIEPKAAGI